ncbi:MAG: phage virion morphogenesis protein [Terracidiphilus sp.]|nr:phage virion morphogenesis protein [Terracidiphilus sp.]
MPTAVKVDDSRVAISLGKFQLSLEQNGELMQEIGVSQLVSIRRTFREQGLPAGSWAPLAPSTIKRDPKRYGPGHKILIGSARLLNSIGIAQERPGQVILGTNVVYARVHQLGSRDRQAFGPRTEAQENATINVGEHSYMRRSAELGTGILGGRKLRIQGPRNARQVIVGSHQRHQNIPARPYLVFRPEDPARIRGVVVRYVNKAKEQAGLGGGQ